MKYFLTITVLFFTCYVALVDADELSVSYPVVEHFYKSPDGTKIYYETAGKGDLVVLVHGFTVGSDSWKKTSLYKNLLVAGYEILIMDLRGNGKSDKPHEDKFYEKDSEAKDIMGIVTQVGAKKYRLIGYSRGSIISSRLLVRDNRISKAVLGGMGLDFTNPNWPRRIMFYEALAGKPNKDLDGFIKYIQDLDCDQQALAMLQKWQPSTSKTELAKIKKPVLVISGADDNDNGSAKELADVIPHSTYIRVAGTHGTTAATADFSDAVLKFLK